jgi:nucleoside-diphosphate-sugar epimerase
MNTPREVVLVTGSSGLIGSAVCRRFAEQFVVVGLDRPGQPHPPKVADCIEVDLTSQDSIQNGLRQVRQRHGERIASVIHLAAYYDFSGEPSPQYEEVTVLGTERLLSELGRFRVGQFIFSSTMLVHAPCDVGERIDEDRPLDPKWDYPRSKVKTEGVIRERRGETPAVFLRIAGVYNDDCHSIPLAHQMQRIAERWMTSRVFPGDISHGQALVHLDDVVDALLLAAQRREELPAECPLLIGEPETLSYDELQRTFGRLIHGEEWETQQIPKALAKTGAWVLDNAPFVEDPFIKPWMIDLADDHYALDISRSRRLLGWRPRRSLRETLPKMIAALKANPRGWYRDHQLKAPENLEEISAPGESSHAP